MAFADQIWGAPNCWAAAVKGSPNAKPKFTSADPMPLMVAKRRPFATEILCSSAAGGGAGSPRHFAPSSRHGRDSHSHQHQCHPAEHGDATLLQYRIRMQPN